MTAAAASAARHDPALQTLIEKWAVPPAELLGHLPRAGQQLDYLGHADCTRALLEADLAWTWEPVATNDAGEPLIVVRDATARMWIRLTVCGVTRLGVGTCPAATFDVEKQLVGDALRNAAMRFGVALSLWSKSEWTDLADSPPPPEGWKSLIDHDVWRGVVRARGAKLPLHLQGEFAVWWKQQAWRWPLTAVQATLYSEQLGMLEAKAADEAADIQPVETADERPHRAS
jgi:hypothetical protein